MRFAAGSDANRLGTDALLDRAHLHQPDGLVLANRGAIAGDHRQSAGDDDP